MGRGGCCLVCGALYPKLQDAKGQVERLTKELAEARAAEMGSTDHPCEVPSLRKRVEVLSRIMKRTISMLETEESTPQDEARRLQGALDGFEGGPIDLSFLDDDQVPPWERDMTPEEEYLDYRRILAKKLGCEDDNTIILEAIGDLQLECAKAEDDAGDKGDKLCILRDKLARSQELEESAKAVTRAVQADNERLKDYQLAKEKTVDGLLAEIARLEDVRAATRGENGET
jgi:chromosome segregation ATPase